MVDNILEASIRVLKHHPYQQFTTNRVAEAAGISIGSLYQYFPNKQSILLELEIRAVNEMIENVEQLLFDTGRPSEERLYSAIEYFFITVVLNSWFNKLKTLALAFCIRNNSNFSWAKRRIRSKRTS